MPGIILDIISPKRYLVQVKEVVWKGHADQIRTRHIPETNLNLPKTHTNYRGSLRKDGIPTGIEK